MGIVHRDLKPANLFLAQRPDGTPIIKVLDFGIAKAQGDTSFNLTRTSSVLGSPGYMSPEQLRSSRDVDVRSDIWSLGVILFELVSGAPPFKAESITELAIRVSMDPTPPLVGRMPHGFDEIVNRCLAKDPAQRYPDLANLSHALAAYAGPGGWELANTVSRVLAGPRLSTGGMAPLAPPRAAPPEIAPPAHGVPTTMGSAASAMVTGQPGRAGGASSGARWGIFAGIAIVVIGAAIGLLVTRDGPAAPAATPAATTAPATAAPAPTAAAAAEPPSAPAPAPDAAGAREAADAAIEAAAGKPPEKSEKSEKPEPPAKPTKPAKPAKPRPPGEDFGESRF
jgi:serine/threonine-protein kinase